MVKEKQSKSLTDAELKDLQVKEDIKKILKIAAGRRLLWWLIKDQCGFMKSCEDINNVYHTYFNEGKRKIGTVLMKRILNIKPDFLAQTISEEEALKIQKIKDKK